MASEWPFVRLEQLAAPCAGSIAIGPFGSRLKSDCYVEEGVALIRGTNLAESAALSGDFVYITPETAKTLGNANLKADDLVFPHRGSIGSVGIVPKDGKAYALSTSLMKISLDRAKALPEFVYYFFRSDRGREELLKNASQVGTPGIATPLKSLRECLVPCPPLSRQSLAVDVLHVLDARIDLLRQTNATLEAVAQALFKSWFVDFDPVRAKAEGREPAGIDAETAALFPSEFEESELGAIPKGWTIRPFTSEFEFTMGQSPPGDSYNDSGDGTPFFQGCTDFGDVSPRLRVFTTQPTRFARAGDVLMSVRAPVGDINVASSNCSIGRGLCSIRHRSGSTGLTVASIGAMRARIETAAGEGALFKSLSKKQLSELPVISFGDHLAHVVRSVLDPLVRSRLANANRIEVLTSLRDTLLPRLISGRLRLPNVNSVIEEALA